MPWQSWVFLILAALVGGIIMFLLDAIDNGFDISTFFTYFIAFLFIGIVIGLLHCSHIEVWLPIFFDTVKDFLKTAIDGLLGNI